MNLLLPTLVSLMGHSVAAPPEPFDVVVLGATPGGIMAAVAAARHGRRVLLLERGAHLGGLPANGLGATDIGTRGATGGLFTEFVARVKAHYLKAYGADSPQVKACSDGYHFEPHVAEAVLDGLLAEQPLITVLRRRQFDARPENVVLDGHALVGLRVTNLDGGEIESYRGRVFIDATYEGDLAAAAGAPFTTRRESAEEYHEPRAGRLYIAWGAPQPGEGSTGAGDDTIQAYNYRLCLTTRPDRVPIEKPADYRREDYASLADDIVHGHFTGAGKPPEGIGWVTNQVGLPNGKTDSNNQHLSFVSTDLPEENWPWPTADWAWRDAFARRLRDYTLGLLWFVQHDDAVPEATRVACRRWGLAADEYVDNGHFPRQVYVREGRRIEGEYRFTAHDALPVTPGGRPPLHADSITASHYALDSHAHHKRESGRVHLDGFFSYPTRPYTVPYGVMVPRGVENLLTPVPASATHVGFSTLRMEPCWMALGQAAGSAAALALEDGTNVRAVSRPRLQERLLADGAVLQYYEDARPGERGWHGLQVLGLRGLIPGWRAELGHVVSEADARAWIVAAGGRTPDAYRPGATTRGELLEALLPLSNRR
jgi:hypothetical protein